MDGCIKELYSINIGGETRAVYKVLIKEYVYLLKCSSCSSENNELIKKLKDEYQTSYDCANDLNYFAMPILCRMKTIVSKRFVIEVLYEYSNETLESKIETISHKEIIIIMKLSLIPLSKLEDRQIFNSGICPHNIFFKDEHLKIIDFGVVLPFGDKSKLYNAINMALCKTVELMYPYCPPEAFQEGKYYPNKVDMYNFVMTLYQLLTRK